MVIRLVVVRMQIGVAGAAGKLAAALELYYDTAAPQIEVDVIAFVGHFVKKRTTADHNSVAALDSNVGAG